MSKRIARILQASEAEKAGFPAMLVSPHGLLTDYHQSSVFVFEFWALLSGRDPEAMVRNIQGWRRGQTTQARDELARRMNFYDEIRIVKQHAPLSSEEIGRLDVLNNNLRKGREK